MVALSSYEEKLNQIFFVQNVGFAHPTRLHSHASALIVIHKSKIVKSRMGRVKRNPPFGSVGFALALPTLRKNNLNQILKYLCITMSASAWERETPLPQNQLKASSRLTWGLWKRIAKRYQR